MNNPNIDESLAEKRNRLLASYAAISTSQNEPMSESQFNAKLLSLSSAQLEEDGGKESGDDERLLETAIRYALAYLEEFDYELKMLGVRMLDRIVDQIRPTRLKLNMRADLIKDTLARYVNDKESVEFLDKSNELMIKLLGVIETKYNTNEHYFKQTSAYIDAALSNCYMSTNTQVKLVYVKHMKTSMSRLGPFACRHLDKLLTVLFDSIELAKINADFHHHSVQSSSPSPSTHLMLASLDLMQALIEACFYRIHSHSRRIIQFLLKLVYSYSCQSPLATPSVSSLSSSVSSSVNSNSSNIDYADEVDENMNKENEENKENSMNLTNYDQFRLVVCLKSVRLVKMLFRNDRIRCSLYDDFKQVKSDAHLNRNFLKLIENI